jgi:hypothetical protein
MPAGIADYDDIAAFAAVATVRASLWNVFLPSETDATFAALTSGGLECECIYKFHNFFCLSLMPLCAG